MASGRRFYFTGEAAQELFGVDGGTLVDVLRFDIAIYAQVGDREQRRIVLGMEDDPGEELFKPGCGDVVAEFLENSEGDGPFVGILRDVRDAGDVKQVAHATDVICDISRRPGIEGRAESGHALAGLCI